MMSEREEEMADCRLALRLLWPFLVEPLWWLIRSGWHICYALATGTGIVR